MNCAGARCLNKSTAPHWREQTITSAMRGCCRLLSMPSRTYIPPLPYLLPATALPYFSFPYCCFSFLCWTVGWDNASLLPAPHHIPSPHYAPTASTATAHRTRQHTTTLHHLRASSAARISAGGLHSYARTTHCLPFTHTHTHTPHLPHTLQPSAMPPHPRMGGRTCVLAWPAPLLPTDLYGCAAYLLPRLVLLAIDKNASQLWQHSATAAGLVPPRWRLGKRLPGRASDCNIRSSLFSALERQTLSKTHTPRAPHTRHAMPRIQHLTLPTAISRL